MFDGVWVGRPVGDSKAAMRIAVLAVAALLAAVCVVVSSPPAVSAAAPGVCGYAQDFDGFADGTTVLGDGSQMNGTAKITGGRLELTNDGSTHGFGSFGIPAMQGTSFGWSAGFTVTIVDSAGGLPPADGMSFNYGNAMLGQLGSGEEGMALVPTVTENISFEIDTWQNYDAEQGLNIAQKVGGVDTDITFTNGPILNDGTSVTGSVEIFFDAGRGLSYTTDGFVTDTLWGNAPTDFVGDDAYTFMLSARVGTATETVLIDDLVIECRICDSQAPTLDLDNPSGLGGDGTAGPDVILGGGFSDRMIAYAGDDSLCAQSNDFLVQGGADDDRIFVEPDPSVRTDQVFTGDGPDGAAGDDRLVVRKDSRIDGVIAGDGQPTGPGGADTIIFAGFLSGSLYGDDVAGDGGADFIAVLPAGDVELLAGDSAGGDGAKDTITIVGNAASVRGDDVDGAGGNDLIAITNGATVAVGNAADPAQGWLFGDRSGGNGGNDFMILRGTIYRGVMGDNTEANGGKDFMRIYPAAVINGPVIGDGGPLGATPVLRAPGFGGNDTIVAFAGSTIDGDVIGDMTTTGGGADRFSLGATIAGSVIGDDVFGGNSFAGDGGNDSIGIGGAGRVASNLTGDLVSGDGGNDILDVSGKVVGRVVGDDADGDGGNDIIYIRAIGEVGPIVGDDVGGDGGDDTIAINRGAVVNGSITGDLASGKGGDDKIIVSGTVHGFINADGSGLGGGTDTITINPAGVVNGNIVATKGTNTIVVRGTVNGDILCSPTTTLQIIGGTVTGDTSTC